MVRGQITLGGQENRGGVTGGGVARGGILDASGVRPVQRVWHWTLELCQGSGESSLHSSQVVDAGL